MSNSATEDSSYRVKQRDEVFAVMSPSGMTILDCRDQHSADHYAVLLTEAYRNGYRAGFRAAKHN